MVNIGASLNRYGLVMSFSSIFLSERNGFNVCFNRPSIPLTLLSVDYGPEILGSKDADGLTQGSGAELIVDSVVPGNSTDIHRVPQL